MSWFLSLGFLLPVTLIATACVPRSLAKGEVVRYRRWVTFLAGGQALVAAAMLLSLGMSMAFGSAETLGLGTTQPADATLLRLSDDLPLTVSVHYDGVAALMFALVSFVGWVICRYSMRYLDGEPSQGRYYRWTSFTIGSVCLMVISGNLLMFVTAWVMTSLGLHQLLLHYGDRPAARRAAWTKFTISRIGDAALLVAITLIYREFSTLEFAELLAAAGSTVTATPGIQAACFLLVAGAITKSAQFPFHTWLPLTMETPTPVSALMHAGIVNAGGYLLIRTSPILALTPTAMTMLAFIGGLTACFGAVVMLTQTSVKKSLAYSTIAQMGFMMLQCGLGAFSAAMLHIIAHSLYKAHAFLSSGSVLTQQAATRGAATQRSATEHALPHNTGLPHGSLTPSNVHPSVVTSHAATTTGETWKQVAGSVLISTAALTAAFVVFQINPLAKPGGLLLGGVLCVSLAYWMQRVMASGESKLVMRSVAVTAAMCFAYTASFCGVDKIVSASLPAATSPTWQLFVAVAVALGFGMLLAIQLRATTPWKSSRFERWQIHAANGFYLDSIIRRVFGPLVSS